MDDEWTLDDIVKVGELRVAAASRRSISEVNHFGVCSFYAAKRPIVILMRRAGNTTAFLSHGPAIMLDELDRTYPGLRGAFEQRCAAMD
ncbi:MAG: hypothetical protein ACR2PA_22895 [Hyphomicrobiaceae bacterium]